MSLHRNPFSHPLLSSLGNLFNKAGQQLIREFRNDAGKGMSQMLFRHRVCSLQLNDNGTVTVEADCSQLVLGERRSEKRRYTAEYAVLALGGVQSIAKSISDASYRKKCVQGLTALAPQGTPTPRAL